MLKRFLHTRIYPYYTLAWVERFRKIQPGDVIVDAGACFGGDTLLFARKAGSKGKVISFEPNPDNFKVLQDNIEKSGLKNMVLINKALGSKKGKVEIESAGEYSSHVIKQGKGKVYKVDLTTLDSELARLKIKKVSLLKMNIEGAEVDAIKGASKTLSFTEHVAISSHVVDGKQTADEIKPRLNESGFVTKLVKRELTLIGHLDLYGFREI